MPYPENYLRWMRRQTPPVGFYAEYWRDPEQDPDYPVLVEQYGDRAIGEVSLLHMGLLREVVAAAGGVLYTVTRLESLLAQVQAYADEHVPRIEPDEFPEYEYGFGHPLVEDASFEFSNLLAWLRALDERLDRPHRPGRRTPRAGLLPSLADRPLRTEVERLVRDYRASTSERALANFVLHAGAIPAPLRGGRLTRDYEVRLPVPDRPSELVPTPLHLSYQQERDAFSMARDAARIVEALLDGLLDAFEAERRAIEHERATRQSE